MNQKLEFAERLQAAMRAAGLEPRPAVLLNLFNANYWGRSVTFQAVSRWLRGESIPAQDKLIVLAGVLKVEPEVLRFGARCASRCESTTSVGNRALVIWSARPLTPSFSCPRHSASSFAR